MAYVLLTWGLHVFSTGLDDEHVVHLVKRKTNAANAPR